MKFASLSTAIVALVLSACANVEVNPESASSTTPPETVAEAVATTKITGRFAPANNLSAYKAQVAAQIVEGHAQAFSGELPPILKSIVVLDLTVDRDGRATRVTLSRSNGFKELERIAMDSVKRAGALPAPTKAVMDGRGNVRYLETWLFRDDGKFQIRSLVTQPQPGAERMAALSAAAQ